VSKPYWDMSCILALYIKESLSPQAVALATKQEQALTSSAILEHEMIFALHAKEAKGEIPKGSAIRVLTKFQSDLLRGRFMIAPLGRDIVNQASRIAKDCAQAGLPLFLRTLDGIHIATAIELKASVIITSDKRMAAAAAHLGVSVNCLTLPTPST